jgi:hypothetical protein
VKFQIVVKTHSGETLPPSPPMDRADAEADLDAIRDTSSGDMTALPWLSILAAHILSASITPAAPSTKPQTFS